MTVVTYEPLAADCWRLIKVLLALAPEPMGLRREVEMDTCAEVLIAMACTSAVEASVSGSSHPMTLWIRVWLNEAGEPQAQPIIAEDAEDLPANAGRWLGPFHVEQLPQYVGGLESR